MTEYLLLLRGGNEPNPAGNELSAAEMQAYIAPYLVWLDNLSQSGQLVQANRLLADGAKTLHADRGQMIVVDGPYTECKDIIGGYYLVNAESDANALALARQCPHLANGGTVELRRIAD